MNMDDIYSQSNDSPSLNPQMVASPSQNVIHQYNNNNNQGYASTQQQQQQQQQHLFVQQTQQQQTPNYNVLQQQQINQTTNFNDSFGHLSVPAQQHQPQQQQLPQHASSQPSPQQPQPQVLLHQAVNNSQSQNTRFPQNINSQKILNQPNQLQQQSLPVQPSLRPIPSMQPQQIIHQQQLPIQAQQPMQIQQTIPPQQVMQSQQINFQTIKTQPQPPPPQQQQTQQQQHIFSNAIQQTQMSQRPAYLQQQNQPTFVWNGIIEWHEKSVTGNNKITKSCVVKAIATDSNITRSVGEKWPDKLTLSLLSNQLFTLLVPQMETTLKRIVFVIDGNNQDLKNILSNQNSYKVTNYSKN